MKIINFKFHCIEMPLILGKYANGTDEDDDDEEEDDDEDDD